MSCCGVNAVTGTTNDFDTSAWITSSSAGSKHIPTSCCSGVTSATYSTYTNTACTNTVTSGYHTKVINTSIWNIAWFSLLTLIWSLNVFKTKSNLSFFKGMLWRHLQFLECLLHHLHRCWSYSYGHWGTFQGYSLRILLILSKSIKSQSINASCYIKHCFKKSYITCINYVNKFYYDCYIHVYIVY